MNGDWVSGPLELTEEELGANRRDFYEDCLAHKLDTDEFWQSRMPDWSKVKVPLFSAANWGGQGLHPRGNFEGFVRAASKQKWLECHGIEHWTHFYTDYGVALQKKFFGHFLKGEKTGWDKQPKVQLQVRHIDKFVERHETAWPLKSTKWTKLFLNPADFTLSTKRQAKKSSVTYKGLGDGVTFLTEPMKQDTEITGPIAAKLWVSSATEDADLFLVVRVFSPDMKEIVFQGALDPQHADRAGLAARVAPQARQEAHPALPALSHPRRGAEAQAGRGVRGRRRGLADLHRGAGGLSHRAHRARQGLRLWRRRVGRAEDARHRVDRRRPVPAQRSARPAGRGVRRQRHAARRAGAECLSAAAGHSGRK